MSRFERDTSVTPLGDGRYGAEIDPGWWIVMGPNGGYIAAMVGRAIEAEAAVAEGVGADRHLHSLTLHYLRPPAAGPVEIDTTVERSGRTVTTVTARMSQQGKLLVLATAAVATVREAFGYSEAGPPEVPPPNEVPVLAGEGPPIEMVARYEMKPCIGSLQGLAAGDEPGMALNGGWIRFAESTPIDAIALTALADAWWPPIFHRSGGVALAVPTVDLTVHVLRQPIDPLDWVLVRFASPEAFGGYVIEHGEIWDAAGNLLAVSRQLAVVL